MDTERPKEDPRAEHRRRRSFGVTCGTSHARVTAIFVGIVTGACKNLRSDMKCSIYERRPLVCRIYPAEISPFIVFDAARKACPPEAWTSGETLLADGKAAETQLQRLIEKSRQTDRDDVAEKLRICRELGVRTAAVADEGYVTYEPTAAVLLAALRKVEGTRANAHAEEEGWHLYSPCERSVQALQAQGFDMLQQKPNGNGCMYLHAPSPLRTPEPVT